MTIHIEALKFDVIIGLLDFERKIPQKIILNLTLEYVYENQNFINYADIVTLLEKNLKEKKYKLLEEALLGTKEIILINYPNIKSIFIKISKPTILPNCIVSVSDQWKL